MRSKKLSPWESNPDRSNSAVLPWLRITAPYYCAAVAIGLNQIVVDTAPILGRHRGEHVDLLLQYCRLQKYEVELVV